MRRKLFFLCLIFLLPMALVTAQESTDQPQLTINSVTDDEFPFLRLLVNAADQNGLPITDLPAPEFQVLVDGTPQNVVSVENITADNLAISVVLMIDTSESMLGTPLEDTKTAALAFLEKLRPGDEVAVAEFDSDVRVIQPFTTDFELARAAINGLTADGRTALWDASLEAGNLALEGSNDGRRFVIFLSDGQEYGGESANGPEAGLQFAAENSIPFYTIGFGYVDATYLTSLAEQSGGQTYILPNTQQLTTLYEYLADYLRTQYIVTVDSQLEPNGEDHSIEVQVRGGNASIDYTAIDLYPQITITGIPEGAISEPVEIQVNATAPRLIEGAGVFVDEAETALPTTENDVLDFENGTFQQTITLNPYDFAPGSHTVSVMVGDQQGGIREIEQTFEVASVPAQFEISGLDEGLNAETPTVDITIDVQQSQSPPAQVIISVDGAQVAEVDFPADGQPLTYTLDNLALGAGNHSVEVTVVEANGTTSSQNVNFSVDGSLFITPSPTPTNTAEPTATPLPTEPPTETPEPTDTPAPTDTPEPTATPEPTDTPAPTDTPEPTNTPEPTEVSALPTEPPTNTPEPTATNTPEPTDTSAPTATNTPEPTDTPEPTNTPEPTDTPAPTATNTPEPTDTPEPTATNTAEPSATSVPSDTPEPTETATPTLTSTPVPPRDVSVPATDEGEDNTLFLAVGGILLLLVLLVVAYFFSRRDRGTSPPK